MKSTSLANHERYLKIEVAKKNAIALNKLREMVYAEIVPIARALIEKAKEGDTRAAELLLERTLGKVKQGMEVDVKFSLSSLAQQWEEREKQRYSEPELPEAVQLPYSEENAPEGDFTRSTIDHGKDEGDFTRTEDMPPASSTIESTTIESTTSTFDGYPIDCQGDSQGDSSQ